MCTAANPAQVTVIWFSTDPIGPGCCCNDQIPRLSVAAGVVEALMLRLGPHAPLHSRLPCWNHSMQVEKAETRFRVPVACWDGAPLTALVAPAVLPEHSRSALQRWLRLRGKVGDPT